MLAILKIIIFILSCGIFANSMKKHQIIVIIIGIITIFCTVYLGKDICEDLGYCKEETFASFLSSFVSSNTKADDLQKVLFVV